MDRSFDVVNLREKRKAFQAWEFPHEPVLWVALCEYSKCKFCSCKTWLWARNFTKNFKKHLLGDIFFSVLDTKLDSLPFNVNYFPF